MAHCDFEQLDSQGFCRLSGCAGAALLLELHERIDHLFASEGCQAGSEYPFGPGERRLWNLVDKGEVFERAMMQGPVLEAVSHLLGQQFKLGCMSARVAEPGNGGAQPLHVDMGLLPDAQGWVACNAMWMLDDFTTENGALRVVPGSHHWRRRPEDVLADPNAPHPDQLILTGKAGDVVVLNQGVWHSGTVNFTSRGRGAMHAFYVRLDIPQHQNSKRHLRPETLRRLRPESRQLLALDDPSNEFPDWQEIAVWEIRSTETEVLSYVFSGPERP